MLKNAMEGSAVKSNLCLILERFPLNKFSENWKEKTGGSEGNGMQSNETFFERKGL